MSLEERETAAMPYDKIGKQIVLTNLNITSKGGLRPREPRMEFNAL